MVHDHNTLSIFISDREEKFQFQQFPNFQTVQRERRTVNDAQPRRASNIQTKKERERERQQVKIVSETVIPLSVRSRLLERNRKKHYFIQAL